MTLALFDLDDTLLDGDCDQLWGQFLVTRGLLTPADFDAAVRYFGQAYLDGTLKIGELLEFQLGLIRRVPPTELTAWLTEFAQRWLLPRLLQAATELVETHRARGHTLVIITATNRVLAQPVADHLGMDALLASEAEYVDGALTGRISGTPCFREGKVGRLQSWLEGRSHSIAESWFYSDSHNDLPLLEQVGHPHAVDPDPRLASHARQRGWPILELHAPRVLSV